MGKVIGIQENSLKEITNVELVKGHPSGRSSKVKRHINAIIPLLRGDITEQKLIEDINDDPTNQTLIRETDNINPDSDEVSPMQKLKTNIGSKVNTDLINDDTQLELATLYRHQSGERITRVKAKVMAEKLEQGNEMYL